MSQHPEDISFNPSNHNLDYTNGSFRRV